MRENRRAGGEGGGKKDSEMGIQRERDRRQERAENNEGGRERR